MPRVPYPCLEQHPCPPCCRQLPVNRLPSIPPPPGQSHRQPGCNTPTWSGSEGAGGGCELQSQHRTVAGVIPTPALPAAQQRPQQLSQTLAFPWVHSCCFLKKSWSFQQSPEAGGMDSLWKEFLGPVVSLQGQIWLGLEEKDMNSADPSFTLRGLGALGLSTSSSSSPTKTTLQPKRMVQTGRQS